MIHTQEPPPLIYGEGLLAQGPYPSAASVAFDETTRFSLSGRELFALFAEWSAMHWIPTARQLPPRCPHRELCSQRVLVAFWHKQFGWIYDVDTLSMGEHQYWQHGTNWTYWRPLPFPPLPDGSLVASEVTQAICEVNLSV
jgi:hypothetical protein